MQMLAVGVEFFADLDRQFPGRRQDQGPRTFGGVLSARPVLLRKLVENGQREGAGLAGAGLGNAQDVPAGEKLGDGAGLDRGRGGMVTRSQGTMDRIGQAEVREIRISHL